MVNDDTSGQGTPLLAWNASRKLAAVPVTTADILVPPNCRAVVVAAHPDDEVLGCGGLLSQLAQLGRGLMLISVTDGGASHPGSPLWPVQRLKAIRPQESADALHRLGVPMDRIEWLRGDFPDGHLADREDQLVTFLEQQLGPTDVVFTTWAHDGHPDYLAVSQACARACAAICAQMHEVPVWAWHWADPEDERLPWDRARKILLDPSALARKRDAIHAFASQLQGDPVIGMPPALPANVLERLLQPFELIFT